jgi:hypothetical protein
VIAGGFEEAAVLRRLRERLWRAVWVQRHAYDEWKRLLPPPKKRGGVAQMIRCPRIRQANDRGDRLFEEAVQDQEDLVDEAERLGFRGRKEWLA